MKLIAALIFLLLPAMAQETPAATLDCAEGMRPFAHAAAEVCIPANPQRIVAVRLQPCHPADRTRRAAGRCRGGFDAATGALSPGGDRHSGCECREASGLASIGNANEPDLEAIAALTPDLILITAWQVELLDQMQVIRPHRGDPQTACPTSPSGNGGRCGGGQWQL